MSLEQFSKENNKERDLDNKEASSSLNYNKAEEEVTVQSKLEDKKTEKQKEFLELKEFLEKEVYPFFGVDEETEKAKIEEIKNDSEITSENIRKIKIQSFAKMRQYLETTFKIILWHCPQYSREEIWDSIKEYYFNYIKDACEVKRNMHINGIKKLLETGHILPSYEIEKRRNLDQAHVSSGRAELLLKAEQMLGFREEEHINYFTFRSNKLDFDKKNCYYYGLLEIAIDPNRIKNRATVWNLDVGDLNLHNIYDLNRMENLPPKGGYCLVSLDFAPILRTIEDFIYFTDPYFGGQELLERGLNKEDLKKVIDKQPYGAGEEFLEVHVVGNIDLEKDIKEITFLEPREEKEREQILNALDIVYKNYHQYWNLVAEKWKNEYFDSSKIPDKV